MDDADPPRPAPQALLSHQGVQEFFKDALEEAMLSQRAFVELDTQVYLVRLLAAYMLSEELFSLDETGSYQQRPLAFLLKDALEEQGPARVQLLRKLGDTSLFVSGFFAESLDSKCPSVDYYIAMGERAYDAVGGVVARTSRSRKPGVFEELSRKFTQLVDVLNVVSERTRICTDRGLLRLYDRFLRTGSTRLSGLLREQGVALPFAPTRGLA